MKDIIDLIMQYPAWVRWTIAGLLGVVGVLLLLHYPNPSKRHDPQMSESAREAVSEEKEGVRVGRTTFLDVSQRQVEWIGLTAAVRSYRAPIQLLEKPFAAGSFADGYPGLLIVPLPYREMIEDQKALAIRDWVERGGGLLVLGYYAADTHHGSNPSRLTAEWGVRFNEDLVMPPGASELQTREQPFGTDESLGVVFDVANKHPLTHGVQKLSLQSSASLEIDDPQSKEFQLVVPAAASDLWQPTGPKDAKGMRPIIVKWVRTGKRGATVGVAFRRGRGRVAVIGTWKLLTRDHQHNRGFVDNLLQWLRPQD